LAPIEHSGLPSVQLQNATQIADSDQDVKDVYE
jgi:hypothetical protein